MARKFITLLTMCIVFDAQVLRAEQVIVNPDVPINHLSANELRSIFSMRTTRWSDGSPIRVFVLPDQDKMHRHFVKAKLEMFPYQLRMTWDRAVFSGTGYPPKKVSDLEDMISRVRNTKGGIGYISDELIPLMEGVKTVEMD